MLARSSESGHQGKPRSIGGITPSRFALLATLRRSSFASHVPRHRISEDQDHWGRGRCPKPNKSPPTVHPLAAVTTIDASARTIVWRSAKLAVHRHLEASRCAGFVCAERKKRKNVSVLRGHDRSPRHLAGQREPGMNTRPETETPSDYQRNE